MRVVVRFLLSACLAALPLLGQGQTTGALSQNAAAMQPGEWRVLNQSGDASGWNYTDITTLIATLFDIFPTGQIYRRKRMSQGWNRLDTNSYNNWFSI